jgi:O-antigen ligase
LNHFPAIIRPIASQQAAAPPVLRLESTTLQRFSFAILIAFLFMIFSRILDVKFAGLHLPGISYRLVGIYLVMSGAFLVAFRESIGRCMLGFTFFFLMAIPFSIWRSGSLQALTTQWLISFVVFMATASLVPDFRQYVRTAKTIAWAVLVLTVICVLLGVNVNGRLFLEQGRFANPNEMAQAMLLGMPFWWAVLSSSRTLLSKLFSSGTLLLMLYVISKTGSRGALVSMLVIVLFMFLRATPIGKLKLMVGGSLMLLAAVVLLPGGLKQRYQTFFSPDVEDADQADQQMLGSALDSTASREELLKRSLIITLKHPLFGVGPSNFEVAENQMAMDEGKRRGAWLGTHNTFTQVSSECGIPAFLFYCAIIILSLKKSYSLYRRTKYRPDLQEINTQALAVNYSLIAFLVTGIFVHAAYTSLLPVLSGLVVSLVRTAEPLVAQAPQAAVATPLPWPAYRRPAARFAPARSV